MTVSFLIGKRGRSSKNFIAGINIFTAAFVIFSCYVLSASASFAKQLPHPSFSSPANDDFEAQRKVLDEVIHDLLHRLGIKADRIFTNSSERSRDNVSWHHKAITVYLSANLSQKAVQLKFRKTLLPFQPPVSFSFTAEKSNNAFNLVTFIDDYPTHKINFLLYPASQSLKKPQALVAIVIDDLGYHYKPARPLFAIKFPLTFSILPFYPFSRRIAEKAHKVGREIILHLPMQSWNNKANGREQEIGNTVLLLTMTKQKIKDQLAKSIAAVPYIKGVSNHMGSCFTEDRQKMGIVIRYLYSQGLFFLDSRTTNKSVGYLTAKEMGLKTAERDIFLDNEESYEHISKQLEELQRIALRNGRAIGIGHPSPATIKALETMLPEFEKKNIRIVPLSVLME